MWPPHFVKIAAQKEGYEPDEIAELLKQIDTFRSNNVQPIMSLKHLSLLTGTDFGILSGVIRRSLREMPYKHIRVRKRNGGVRHIYEPLDFLKYVQRWLLDHVLKQQPVSHYCYGVSSQYNQIQCAKQHCGSRWMLHLDLEDFFGSIDETHAYTVFLGLGYSPFVAFELARLSTYPFAEHSRRQIKYPSMDKVYKLHKHDKLGTLPQGAPTSTALSNLLMKDLDEALGSLCLDKGWCYTRYVDDLTFSTLDKDITRKDVKRLYHNIRDILFPFQLNPQKTVFSPPGARKMVLGLLVDGERVRLNKHYRKCVKMHLYYCNRVDVGVVEHSKKRKFHSPLLFLDHLLGKINYAYQVEPERASKWLEAFCEIKRKYETKELRRLDI